MRLKPLLNGASAPASLSETLHPSGAVSLMGETPSARVEQRASCVWRLNGENPRNATASPQRTVSLFALARMLPFNSGHQLQKCALLLAKTALNRFFLNISIFNETEKTTFWFLMLQLVLVFWSSVSQLKR